MEAHSLTEAITQIQQELAEVVSSQQEAEFAQQHLEWLQELQALKTSDKAALENALCALRRLQANISPTLRKTAAGKHRNNRIHKLINNIEELLELETKEPEPPSSPPKKKRTPPSGRGRNKRRK